MKYCPQCKAKTKTHTIRFGNFASELAAWVIFGILGFLFFPLWLIPIVYSAARMVKVKRYCEDCGHEC